jgi:hypothetical protein
MKRLYKICFLIFCQISFLHFSLCAQDTLLTAQDAVKNAIENNYGIIISKNEIEIGSINNNWANAGAIPVISASANKTVGTNNLDQRLSNGTVTRKRVIQPRTLVRDWKLTGAYLTALKCLPLKVN